MDILGNTLYVAGKRIKKLEEIIHNKAHREKKLESIQEKERDSVGTSNVCLIGVLEKKKGVKLFIEIKAENFSKLLEDSSPHIADA